MIKINEITEIRIPTLLFESLLYYSNPYFIRDDSGKQKIIVDYDENILLIKTDDGNSDAGARILPDAGSGATYPTLNHRTLSW